MRKLCLIPALAMLTSPFALSAQAETTSDQATVLDMITIIGTGLPTEVMKNPASVMLIEADEITRQSPVTIAGLLRDVPGLQISEEGIERISLRGEQSRRVAILLDGQALTDHGNYGQPIPVDPTQIERIEVVRGSSSVVSGNRAIGGVINIITKKGAAKPFELTTNAGWFSATRGWRASTSAAGTLPLGAGEFDYRLSYGRMKQENRRSPDGEIPNTDTSDRNLSLHAGYRLGDHYFGLRGQATDLAAGVYTGNPDFFVDLPRRDLRKTTLLYEGTNLTPWLEKLSADIYRQGVAREFRNDSLVPTLPPAPPGTMRIISNSDDSQRTWGAKLTAEMRFSDNTRTVAGLQYEDDSLTTKKLTGEQPPGAPFPIFTPRRDEASVRTLSIFAEHEVSFTPTLTSTFGTRWYRVRVSHDASYANGLPVATNAGSRNSLALGAAGLVWSPDESLALRANISQGYIYPTLGQLYLTTQADSKTTQGNSALRPERATTYELGTRISRGPLELDAVLFHTSSRDYITRLPIALPNGRPGFQFDNVSRARTTGLEMQAEYASTVWDLTPYASAALLRRELRFENGIRTTDSGTPRISGRVGVRKLWSLATMDIETDLFLRGESSTLLLDANGDVDNSKEAGGWATLNLATSVNWDNGVSLVAEINNITNRRYHPFEQAPGAERSINIFLSRSF